MKFSRLGQIGALVAALSASVFPVSSIAQNSSALVADAKTPGDVLTYGMGYNHQRYSTLTKINKGNVKNLVPAWNLSLDHSANASTQPIIADGVMYVAIHNATVAVDAVSGQAPSGKHPIELPADINGFLCCGIHTRGAGDCRWRHLPYNHRRAHHGDQCG